MDAVRKIIDEKLVDRLLISQDAGVYNYGEKNNESTIFPYSRIFKEFIPLCKQQGISQELIEKLLIKNPLMLLDIN